jgi:hypothetical protein
LGKLVHQLPGVVTFAYDLHVLGAYDSPLERYLSRRFILGAQSCLQISLRIFPKNLHLGPQNGPEVKTAKNSKLPKLPENYFEPVGKGGWPLISTWINAWVEAVVVAISFCSPFEQIVKKLNFVV